MEEFNLIDILENRIKSKIDKKEIDFEQHSNEVQLMIMSEISTFSKVLNWIWSLKKFGKIDSKKIKEKTEGDKEIIEYYQNHKEEIEMVKKHGDKIHKAMALTIESYAKRNKKKN